MFNVQTKKSSLGQMLEFLKKRLKYIFEIDYKKDSLFLRKATSLHGFENFSKRFTISIIKKNMLVVLMDLEIFEYHFC